ncbi:MAG TPA: transaldolase [Acidimicrobiales bacterium]|nr:transaldolase [Acidimicrobiales bacterium]
MSEAGGSSPGRSRLHDLYAVHGQSPWLDNLTRPMISSGRLQGLVDAGVRGVTSNPTIFAKAFEATTDYDAKFADLVAAHTVEDAYWELVIDDVVHALDVLTPVHRDSGGTDGFVSLEVAPAIAHDGVATAKAARYLHGRIGRSNLLVKIPATKEGVAAIRTMVGEGANINVTLIFGLDRYDEVMEAYLSGLEAVEGDLSGIHGVASFFVSRVDTLVDRLLDEIGTPEALALRGRTAVAQARVAYQHFLRHFSGPRWEALRARGACAQRPLWASTSTKNPAYPDLLYVDGLIGPDTVNTMPEATLDAFADHGTLARTIDAGGGDADRVLADVAAAGVDMDDVATVLEGEGVATFAKSYDELIQRLQDKANTMAAGQG